MKAWRSCGELMEHFRDCEIIGHVGICRYSGTILTLENYSNYMYYSICNLRREALNFHIKTCTSHCDI